MFSPSILCFLLVLFLGFIFLAVKMQTQKTELKNRLTDLELNAEKIKKLEKRVLDLEITLVVRLEDRICKLEKKG